MWNLARGGLLSTTCRGFTTLESQESAGVIPPELLTTTKTALRPDRDIDLVTRVTSFHGEDNGFMVFAGDVFDVPIRKDIIHHVVRNRTGKRELEEHDMGLCVDLRHGATMHGPKPRSHAIKLQKKVRRLGLKIALSARTFEGKGLNVYSILLHDTLVMTRDAVSRIVERMHTPINR
ncbi:hypothetical protein C4D60_Mb10t00660 [Musa balbisiana]|uniref:Large ribosomal subunit protein uL4m n=1 Tax=Musa balbisiana TaxID=52838 RepID=A0A4S8ITP2_MUSBA|nr:hypothetical protein C4D60_Mb10t00660 [Musa balbisiana]